MSELKAGTKLRLRAGSNTWGVEYEVLEVTPPAAPVPTHVIDSIDTQHKTVSYRPIGPELPWQEGKRYAVGEVCVSDGLRWERTESAAPWPAAIQPTGKSSDERDWKRLGPAILRDVDGREVPPKPKQQRVEAPWKQGEPYAAGAVCTYNGRRWARARAVAHQLAVVVPGTAPFAWHDLGPIPAQQVAFNAQRQANLRNFLYMFIDQIFTGNVPSPRVTFTKIAPGPTGGMGGKQTPAPPARTRRVPVRFDIHFPPPDGEVTTVVIHLAGASGVGSAVYDPRDKYDLDAALALAFERAALLHPCPAEYLQPLKTLFADRRTKMRASTRSDYILEYRGHLLVSESTTA